MNETYDNVITGKATIWNTQTQQLTLRVDVNPINDSFTDRIIDSALYNRNAVTGDQLPDIFRVGDFIKYPTQPDEENAYLEVGKVLYTDGLDFVAEDTSKNGSAIAKYVTKEVTITNPATAIDVHLLANVKDLSLIHI